MIDWVIVFFSDIATAKFLNSVDNYITILKKYIC